MGVEPVAELQICLLGSFEVCWDFHPVAHNAWRHPLAQRLLKLVLLRRPEPVAEVEALQLLGGDLTAADLQATIAAVNQVLSPGASLQLSADRMVSFDPGRECWIDLEAMEAHYRSGVSSAARGEMFPAILALQEADAIYQGALLEESQESWVLPLRHALNERYTEILERLAEGHAVLARYQDAVGFCHKALAHDPFRESTYQRMMVYYYYLGDLAGAEEAYRECLQTFDRAGRRINGETIHLWERLRSAPAERVPGATAAAALLEQEKPDDPTG